MIRSASTGEEEAADGVVGGGGLAVGSFCLTDDPPCAPVNKSIKVELWGKVEVGAGVGVGVDFGFDFGFLDRLGCGGVGGVGSGFFTSTVVCDVDGGGGGAVTVGADGGGTGTVVVGLGVNCWEDIGSDLIIIPVGF